MGAILASILNTMLDAYFGSGTPATLYFGLSTTDPGSDGSGATEPSGGSYARVAKTNNATNFPAAAAGVQLVGTDTTWPTATANWGTLTHIPVYDAATAGNWLFTIRLDASRTILTNDTFMTIADALSIPITVKAA